MSQKPINYGSIRTDLNQGGSRSLDISMEFNNSCDSIASNLLSINSAIKYLQDSLKLVGSPKDNVALRSDIHVKQHSANQLASAATQEIRKLKEKVPRHDKQRILQLEKLEGDFRETVNKYYSIQKKLAEKQKSHLLVAASIEHQVFDDEENANALKQEQMTKVLQFEEEMMLEREQRVKQIESDILDVNAIMRELGSIVYKQGEVIDTIENSIDYTATNVEAGTSELLKASGYQNRYRKKLLILVIIAIIAAIILITLLVRFA